MRKHDSHLTFHENLLFLAKYLFFWRKTCFSDEKPVFLVKNLFSWQKICFSSEKSVFLFKNAQLMHEHVLHAQEYNIYAKNTFDRKMYFHTTSLSHKLSLFIPNSLFHTNSLLMPNSLSGGYFWRSDFVGFNTLKSSLLELNCYQKSSNTQILWVTTNLTSLQLRNFS